MRLSEREALAYLKGIGFEISRTSYYREKKKVESMKLERLVHIAQIGFQDQHIDRIDNTELALKLMWQNYHLEQDPYKKFQMLKDIIAVQPYLSSYYEASKIIIEKRPDLVDNIKNLQSEQDGTRTNSGVSIYATGEQQQRRTDNRSTTDLNRKF